MFGKLLHTIKIFAVVLLKRRLLYYSIIEIK